MALVYERAKDPDASKGMVTVERRLYLTEDGERVVPDGHPAARWLWATPGSRVSRADAERLGALTPEPEARQEKKPSQEEGNKPTGAKRRQPRTNKARQGSADKAADTGSSDEDDQATTSGSRW
ncbi:hypothetical protein AB0I72_19210 [Nocardiopsis sp. NPDC049922]|uniref:hypothetical protein n=1 Tax=Nocardiopsis sp. NPDC049922 TaxID=3155157 RepID=UPI0033FA2F98